MKRPEPPLLGFGFYFSDIPDADAFARLIQTLTELDTRFTGSVSVHEAKQARNAPFASITDDPLPVSVTMDDGALRSALFDPDRRVMELCIEGAIGIARKSVEIVSYVSISPEAAMVDHHPLAIWTEGGIFEDFVDGKKSKRKRKTGKKIYERFISIVRILCPDYATITLETSVECPTDLHKDPRSYAFRDFYITNEFIGSMNLSKIEKIFPSSYKETLQNGIYISTSDIFNPEGIQVDTEHAEFCSVEVGKIISRSKI